MAARKSTTKAKSTSAPREASPATASAGASPVRKSAKKATTTTSAKTVNINIKPARYYSQIPAFLRTKPAPAKKGILSSLASSLFGGNRRGGAKVDGSKVRDFPFMTAAGPQFFCTDRAACQRQFGVSRNDRLVYKYGPFAGTYCSVLGMRGGLLWVVNDASKKTSDSGIPRPEFIEKDLTGAFDNGYATPLYGVENGADLEEAGLEFCVKGGMLEHSTAVDDLPAPLVNFLRYAPDMSLKIPQTNDTLVIPPILTPTGEVGWSSAGAFNAFAPEGVAEPTEARVLVSIVPLLVPAEYLSDNEAEEETTA